MERTYSREPGNQAKQLYHGRRETAIAARTGARGGDRADDFVAGVRDDAILRIEACLWTEQVRSIDTYCHYGCAEIMMYPRLAGLAEIGWSPQAARAWTDYRERLIDHLSRWDVMGVTYHDSPLLHWDVRTGAGGMGRQV